MKFVNTLVVNGETYVLQDKNAVTEDQLAETYVKFTDYADIGKSGVVKLAAGCGLYLSDNNQLYIHACTEGDIKNKTGSYRPITPKFVDAVVKYGITANKNVLTDAEKAAACGWLGTGVITGNADGTLTITLADGSKFRVNATKEEA